MVNSYDHTNNFNLPLYKDNTPADFRDGYNSAMRSIDENAEYLYRHQQGKR